MALSIVGSSPLVQVAVDGADASVVFTPTGSWAVDDILTLLVLHTPGSGNTVLTLTDDSGFSGFTSLGWHQNTTAGTGAFTDSGGVNSVGATLLWARIPDFLDGSSSAITLTVREVLHTGLMVLPGKAVRGAKRVKRRHTATGTADTNDYKSSGSGASPRQATLAAHAGTNDGSAGAIEYVVGYSVNGPSNLTNPENVSLSGMDSNTVASFYEDWDGTKDLWLAAGYKLHNTGPTNETASQFQMDGWTSGSKTAQVIRAMFILEGNTAPTITIDSTADLGSLVGQVVLDSISDEYSVASDPTFPYPLTYDIDWGDGSGTQTIDISLDGYTLETGYDTQSHAYGAGGTYTIEVTITDENGATDTDTMDVTIVGPSNTLGPRYEIKTRRVHARELPYGVTQRMWNETIAGR